MCKIVQKIASEIFVLIFLITHLCISKHASWWVDFRTENQIGNFRILNELWTKNIIFWTTPLIFLKTFRWISKSFKFGFQFWNLLIFFRDT